MTPTRKLWLVLALTLAVVAGLASYVAVKRRAGLPSPGSEAYEQTTRRFFRGLAALQVGLVDAAKAGVHAGDCPCAGRARLVGEPGAGALAAR